MATTFRLRARLVFVLLTLCTVGAALAGASQASKPANGETQTDVLPLSAFQGMTPSEAVVAAYAKLQRLIQASGDDIHIEISDTAEWAAAQLSTLEWASIAEYPEGSAVAVSPTTKMHPDGQVSTHYSANWVRGEGSWFYLAEHLRQDRRSVSEVLAEAGTAVSWVQDLDTLVTYQVFLRLEGRKQRYRAAMLFSRDAAGIRRLHPVDYLLQGVDAALTQAPTLLTDEVVLAPKGAIPQLDSMLDQGWTRPGGYADKTTCLPLSSERTRIKSASGYNGHISGKHSVEAEFVHSCVCDADCTSTCDSDTNWTQCVDLGQTQGYSCHKLSTNGNKGTSSANGSGASCGGAEGCAQVTCPTPVCGICSSVPVSINGGPVTFSMTVSGSADWSYLIESTHSCAPCVEAPDGGSQGAPPNQGGDPNGGGGSNPTSPILINLEGQGFFLTGLDDPVSFDLDADGFAETVGWSTREGDEAFLVLDRNGNGTIDDGRELFGNFTDQPPSDDPNGFLALTVFDDGSTGGNADGIISAEDAIFPWLQLWHDRDHDGLSTGDELTPLDESEVVAIHLSPVFAQRRDRHGNLLRYAAQVQFAGPPHQGLAAIDVFFVTED